MNVITFGDETSAYCETVCGGAGAVSNRYRKSLRSTTFHTINFYRKQSSPDRETCIFQDLILS